MKKSVYAAFMIAAMGLTACGGNEEAVEEVENDAVEAATYSLIVEESSIAWTGSWVVDGEDGEKVRAKEHEGAVAFSNGTVEKNGDEITGSFAVNMATIEVTDIGEDEGKGSLESHLKGEREGAENHFFRVAEYAQTSVQITGITNGEATIILTVLGSDIELTAPMSVKEDGDKLMLSGDFSVDFSVIGIEGVEPNPEKPEAGHVNPVIDFSVNAVLSK